MCAITMVILSWRQNKNLSASSKEIRRIIVVINEFKKKDKMFGSHYKANQIYKPNRKKREEY